MAAGPDIYSVALSTYNGPMDLLLYLVKSQELDLHDIPVATICDQYLEFLETLEQLDLAKAGEFLVMASTLIELKSRILLPTEPIEGDEEEVEDPRSDLVRKLLEYKRFRDMAEELGGMRQEYSSRYPRGGPAWDRRDATPQEITIEATLWDLLAAFQKVMREVALKTPRTIVYDDTPITDHMVRIVATLQREESIEFSALFEGRTDRGFIISTFLALLELCKLLRIRAEESEDGESVRIFYREPPDDDLSESLGLTIEATRGAPEVEVDTPPDDPAGDPVEADSGGGLDGDPSCR